MHFPKLALHEGGFGRGVGRGGVLVEGQRHVLEHDAHVFWVFLRQTLEGRTDPPAVRSLKVRKFDDRDLCVFGPNERRLANCDLINFARIRATVFSCGGCRRRRRRLEVFNTGHDRTKLLARSIKGTRKQETTSDDRDP